MPKARAATTKILPQHRVPNTFGETDEASILNVQMFGTYSAVEIGGVIEPRLQDSTDALLAKNVFGKLIDFESRFFGIDQRLRRVEEKESIISVEISELHTENYRLKRPIKVILRFVTNGVIAVIPELELHADGLNEIDAINELKAELLDLYDDLSTMPDNKLGKAPRSWKRLLTSIIEKNVRN